MKELRILIVDDEATAANVLSDMINYFFPESHIDTAGNPAVALEALKNHYDIVISDFNLKNKDFTGIDILRMAKELYPGARTVLMSGNFQDEYIAERLGGIGIEAAIESAAIDALWEKPMLMEQIKETMTELIREERE